MNIGEAIKERRLEKEITQKQLAKETNLSQSGISYWKKNKRIPNIIECITLADFYGITLDELVGRE